MGKRKERKKALEEYLNQETIFMDEAEKIYIPMSDGQDIFCHYSIKEEKPSDTIFFFVQGFANSYLTWSGFWDALHEKFNLVLVDPRDKKSNVLKKEGGLEEKKGFITTKLVDAGIYRVIRHPIYGSMIYLFLGLALISQHPVSLFLGLTTSPLCYYFMIEEEKLTIEKFGDDYLKYMSRVPRFNLFVGIWRILKR